MDDFVDVGAGQLGTVSFGSN